ncbi:MAG: Haloacid dehalogenase domain protein hydrolase type 3 [Firmicutes bacterium]|nr:Haloacid dehalogenase domain protein hydrolase type 3 [Bacillota bacterium]
MLFASDLDQTLIYSPKSFRLLPGEPMPAASSIEIYDGREISFMADNAIAKLKKIASQSIFVPVTTRTIDQYLRISLFRENMIPAYGVVSNGGNIIVDGVVDQAWRGQVAMVMDQMCLCPEDMLASFNELCHESWAGPMRMADGLFYYCVVERDKVPLNDIESFAVWAGGQQWNVSLQGRKLYIVPQVVNKWSAVAYIRDILQEKLVITAGDSLLDLCMLEQADYAIAPAHGELWDCYTRGALPIQALKFTKQAGILAANDILDYVDRFAVNGTKPVEYEVCALRNF